MMRSKIFLTLLLLLPALLVFGQADKGFITIKDMQFFRNGRPYYFMGMNYWYGMNMGASGSAGKRERLMRELDQLKALGVSNLRIVGSTEGPDTEPYRITPSLQHAPGQYNEEVLEGLDFLLAEMGRREISAVVVLNNFWVWTGGMSQYLTWVHGGSIPYPPPAEGGSWEAFPAFTSAFYGDKKANELFRKHIAFLLERVNKFTGIKYKDDPTIMSWQLSNEPRAYNNQKAYREWLHSTAAYIKSLDKNHLVSTGSEGNTGSHHAGTNFLEDHKSANIDYGTIHIWIQNWGWFDPHKPEETMPLAMEKAKAYLKEHVDAAQKLKKPLVLEEFGVPRDREAYATEAPTTYRDLFFTMMFDQVYEYAKAGKGVAGCNMWSWAGEGRPNPARADNIWKSGDDFIGDPPHEPQGWYSIYEYDTSTITAIRTYATLLNSLREKPVKVAK